MKVNNIVMDLIERLNSNIQTLEEIINSDKEEFLYFKEEVLNFMEQFEKEESKTSYKEVDEVQKIFNEKNTISISSDEYIKDLELENEVLHEQVLWYKSLAEIRLKELEKLR